MTTGSVRAPSTARRRAFRLVAAIFGVAGIAFSIPFTVFSFVDDGQALHRMHNVAFTALYAALLGVPLLLSARDPEGNRSAFLVAVASGLAGAIAGLLSGDFLSGAWFTAPIIIVLLWILHPARGVLLRPSGIDPATAAMSIVALVPAVAFALTQARFQREGLAADPHRELHHYSGMAATTLGLAVCGLAAALRLPGRRLAVWLVAAAALIVGVGSLLLSDHAGSLDPMWASLTVAWGLALAAIAEVTERRALSSGAAR